MNPTSPVLGRLEPVDLRTIWEHEAEDFTPWLAGEQNIALRIHNLAPDPGPVGGGNV